MEKTKGKKIPASALLIILGLLLVIFRNAAPETVMRILAAGLIVVGAASIFQAVRDKESKKSSRIGKGLVHSLLIILGIAILVKTGFFTGIFKYVLGGVMIFLGLKDMIPAIRYKLGWLKIILSAVAIFLGAYLIFFPPGALTLFSGLSLIYCGVTSIFGGSKKSDVPKNSRQGSAAS